MVTELVEGETLRNWFKQSPNTKRGIEITAVSWGSAYLPSPIDNYHLRRRKRLSYKLRFNEIDPTRPCQGARLSSLLRDSKCLITSVMICRGLRVPRSGYRILTESSRGSYPQAQFSVHVRTPRLFGFQNKTVLRGRIFASYLRRQIIWIRRSCSLFRTNRHAKPLNCCR